MIALFAILGVVAIMLLSGFSPNRSADENRYGDRVLIWGTLPAKAFDEVIDDLQSDDAFDVVTYRQVDERSFNETFVNAIAEGRSPDLVLLPNTEIVRQRSKLLAISYDTFSLRDFKDQFIDGAEIFALADGTYAQPLGVDPLVMYWNRDLLTSGGFAQPPTTWEFLRNTSVPGLVVRDNARNVSQAAVAFGESRNILHAKDVLLLLAIQSGSRLIYEDGARYEVGLDDSLATTGLPPMQAALQFFMTFSDPGNQAYTWNRAQALDRNAFVAGDLALYFGLGTELPLIQGQNPNLNFDVAPVPQGAATTIRRNYGVFYGFAIPKASPNARGAYGVANVLVSPQVSQSLTGMLNLAPVNRQVLAAGTEDIFKQSIYSVALTARGWLDPDPAATNVAFQTMIEDVNAGRRSVSDSVDDFSSRIRLAF